ncbi:hyaluronoglucosaminidase [Streptomyces pristinaespiralis]|uniref:hyaluronoglucosaminidase n=1 Tax=Streptomyces pristinaespiralis TaxID=38300 RepID=UPI0038335372
MSVSRRLFLGGFTAGAVTVAAGAAASPAAAAEADGPTTTFDGPVVAEGFRTDSTVNSAFFKTTSTTEHAVTAYQAGTSGSGVALNVVSKNPGDSAMYLSGTEKAHGTLKISHTGHPDGSDEKASALSIDLLTAGTAAQGIFVKAGNGPTTGNLICLRNNARDDFVVKGSGRVGIGMGVGGNPWSQLHVVQQPGHRLGADGRGHGAGRRRGLRAHGRRLARRRRAVRGERCAEVARLRQHGHHHRPRLSRTHATRGRTPWN